MSGQQETAQILHKHEKLTRSQRNFLISRKVNTKAKEFSTELFPISWKFPTCDSTPLTWMISISPTPLSSACYAHQQVSSASAGENSRAIRSVSREVDEASSNTSGPSRGGNKGKLHLTSTFALRDAERFRENLLSKRCNPLVLPNWHHLRSWAFTRSEQCWRLEDWFSYLQFSTLLTSAARLRDRRGRWLGSVEGLSPSMQTTLRKQ